MSYTTIQIPISDYFSVSAQERLAAAALAISKTPCTVLGYPEGSNLGVLMQRVLFRPLPLDDYGEPVVKLDDVADADFIFLFNECWSSLQSHIFNGSRNYGRTGSEDDSEDPVGDWTRDLIVYAQSFEMLVRNAAGRFRPAKGYSMKPFVDQLMQFANEAFEQSPVRIRT